MSNTLKFTCYILLAISKQINNLVILKLSIYYNINSKITDFCFKIMNILCRLNIKYWSEHIEKYHRFLDSLIYKDNFR